MIVIDEHVALALIAFAIFDVIGWAVVGFWLQRVADQQVGLAGMIEDALAQRDRDDTAGDEP